MALWRVEQTAEYLGIRPKTLYEWVRLGRVPYRKIGFNVRFDPAEIEAWASSQSKGIEESGGARDQPSAAPAPGRKQSAAAAAGKDLGALRELAADAAQALRQIERDVGASLSFPQRQQLDRLAERLEAAAKGDL